MVALPEGRPSSDFVHERGGVGSRRPLGPAATSGRRPPRGEVRAALDHPLTDDGVGPAQVVSELARDLTPYITAHASGRFFGFVIGGLHPAAWGAELLVSTWDQNAGLFPPTPGAAVAEQAAQWLVDLLHLPAESSVGFVTGGQMANFTCLAAARHEVLRQTGWDVEADGLTGSPGVTVVLEEGVHSTVLRALRFRGSASGWLCWCPATIRTGSFPRRSSARCKRCRGPRSSRWSAGT